MSLINKLFSARGGSAFGGKNKKKEATKETEPVVEAKKIGAEAKKSTINSKILISSHTAEKALMDQKLNHYVFKVSPTANKIMIANEVKKNYNVKVIKVNIVNIPKKARRIGRTKGFRAGYKKAIVTLAPGQTIEAAK